MEGGRRRIIVQDGRGELGVEAAHIAREFGKSEIARNRCTCGVLFAYMQRHRRC